MSAKESAPKQLTAAQLLKHPEFPHVIWPLKPEKKGKVKCGGKKGYNIAYELHGTGPRHLVLIMGLSEFMTSWMRTTKDFGHTRSNEYTVLILDNRGMGDSDRPLYPYSTSGMAQDVIEVLDHVGWTQPRSVHVCGASMGGMIALELASKIPERCASLILVSTAAKVVNDLGFWENTKIRLGMVIPKSIDEQIQLQKEYISTKEIFTRPDEDEYVVEPFPTMGDRLGANELAKRTSGKRFTKAGLICQAIACMKHNVSPDRVKQLADRVGRQRICVMHGKVDRTLSPSHGEVLMEMLDRGAPEGQEIRRIWWSDMGHAWIVERREGFHKAIEEVIESTGKLDIS